MLLPVRGTRAGAAVRWAHGIAGAARVVVVVEEGGLSAAARRLHVGQAAGPSRAAGGLERRLGVELLVRGSNALRAADAGTTLLGEARAVPARFDQAVRAMARHTGTGGGVLRIGIPPRPGGAARPGPGRPRSTGGGKRAVPARG